MNGAKPEDRLKRAQRFNACRFIVKLPSASVRIHLGFVRIVIAVMSHSKMLAHRAYFKRGVIGALISLVGV